MVIGSQHLRLLHRFQAQPQLYRSLQAQQRAGADAEDSLTTI